MKIKLEIDCTPQEAREFLGLPDVKPIQDEWLENVGAALMGNPENFSPESMVKNWSRTAAPAFDAMPDLFQSLLKAAAFKGTKTDE